MTKNFFQRQYPEEYVPVEDGDRTSDGIVVGKLGLEGFVETFKNFILEIDRIIQLGHMKNR
jgi:hypothetical protein